MNYNLKYFDENKIVISEDEHGAAYDLDNHRIGICQCDRSCYVSVFVDGETVATRTKRSNAIRLALEYMSEAVQNQKNAKTNERDGSYERF